MFGLPAVASVRTAAIESPSRRHRSDYPMESQFYIARPPQWPRRHPKRSNQSPRAGLRLPAKLIHVRYL